MTRLAARRKPAAGAQAGAGTVRFLPPAREMPDNAVFISYAREDLAAVQQLKAGLEAAGVTTWFDMERLESGDDYDLKIQRNIARCSYFIPVVSAATQRRHEAYFRREWSYALDRARNMADGALFILPVTIDATNAAEALVPDRFKALHFTQLPGGARDTRIRGAPGGLHAGTTAMNAEPTDAGIRAPIDERHPWLGLASFTEETRSFFYGRDEEVAELARRVQRKLLTVLFGQSGLGQDFDPARRASCRACAGRATARSTCASTTRPTRPSPASRSSRRSCRPPRHSGEWTQAGVATAGESLWEFLHHRDDVLRDESGQHAHSAADLRPVRGDLHARPERRGRPRARRALHRRAGGPGREPPADGRSRRGWRPTN